MSPAQTPPIADLLAHGPGFRLLDRMLGHDEESATCEVVIRRDSPFSDGATGVPAWVGIEYMAQAVGVLTSLRRLRQGRAVQIGFLLGARQYESSEPFFPIGATLTVRARQLVRDSDGVGAFDCELRRGDAVIARAEVKAFDPDDIEPFLDALAKEAP